MIEYKYIEIFIILYAIYTVSSIAKKIINLRILKLQIDTQIDPNVIELLENFIEVVFDDYILSKPEYIKKTYITEEDEITIREEMVDEVSEKISPYMYQKLSVYYNEEYIPDIIATKIFQYITSYVVSKNQIKHSKEELNNI